MLNVRSCDEVPLQISGRSRMTGRGRLQAAGTRDTINTMTTKPWPLVAYSPLGVTALLVLWTVFVSPHSRYGDSWAIDPALVALPLVVGLHVLLAYKSRWRSHFITYGIVHCAILFPIWFWCLTMISKDSL